MRIQNLGPISDATVHLNNLTLFIGNNDTGKTLTAYSTFAFRNWLERFVPDLLSMQDFNVLRMNAAIQINLQKLQDSLKCQLVEAFNALNEEGQYFQDFFRDKSTYRSGVTKITIDNQDLSPFRFRMDEAHFEYATMTQHGQSKRQNYVLTFEVVDGDLKISQNEVANCSGASTPEQVLVRLNRLLKGFFVDSFSNVYLPAERMGINVLRTQLKNQVIEQSFANPVAIKTSGERYPYPIEAYINYLNGSLDLVNSQYNEKVSVEESQLLQKLVPGTVSFDEVTSQIKYRGSGENSKQIGFSSVSSSLKSLLGIELFFKNNNAADSWLIIDEPEMGLHPMKQKLMMDLLYQLAVADGHVVIATHSDYLVKELINQVLASKLTDTYNHVGMADKVSVYEFSSSGVRNLGDISSQDQAGLANFDRVTDEINNRYYDLVEKMWF